jgi:hypothetical protein
MTGSGGSPDSGQPDPSDFDKRLAEMAAGLAKESKFRELSAAKRARQAQTAQRRARRRKYRPDGTPPMPGSRGRRGRAASLAITLVIIVALSAAAFGLSKLHTSGNSAASPDNTPVANGATPSPQATVAPVLFTPADPFAGSPAEDFSDGSAGIVIPAAHAVGGYSAGQVRAAYATVRRLLIAGYLNRMVLAGRSPAAFARLLTPAQRSWFDRRLDRQGLTKRGYARSTRTWLTAFAPRSTDLVGTVIKVHGRMTAAARGSGNNRVLSIHANYLFVYPIQQAGGGADTRMRAVTLTVLTVHFATWNDPGGPLEPWVSGIQDSQAGALCGINDGFVHPAFPGGPPGPIQPSGPPVNPYDQSTPPSAHSCQPTTGT